MTKGVDISVCVATFRRPRSLERLLLSLVPLVGSASPRIEIVVVDNDAGESARAVVEAMRQRLSELRYCVEPRQNISLARNRGVEEARGEWIAFIDDDEIASERWLSSYWQATREIPADGYFGPVLPLVQGTAPDWLVPEIFLGLSRPPHGSLLDASHTRTTNALIQRRCLARQRFDPDYGISGGGDYELFARMLDAGARFRWCDGAATSEYYAADRLSLRWVLRRAFRGGNTYTHVECRRHPGWATWLRHASKAALGSILFLALVPIGALGGRTRAVTFLQRWMVQLGHLWALLGRRYEEYRVRG